MIALFFLDHQAWAQFQFGLQKKDEKKEIDPKITADAPVNFRELCRRHVGGEVLETINKIKISASYMEILKKKIRN